MCSQHRYGMWRRSSLVAERMSFSSFSSALEDVWGREIKRDYGIVLFPGYRPPVSLDKGSKDSVWRDVDDLPLTKPAIVWDGFSANALFEIIYECFDYRGPSEFIRVVEFIDGGKKYRKLTDPRPKNVMEIRPRRKHGWGPNRALNHLTDLCIWASLLGPRNETVLTYDPMIMSADTNRMTIEALKRDQGLADLRRKGLDMFDESHRVLEECARTPMKDPNHRSQRGPVPDKHDARSLSDVDVALYCLRYKSLKELATLDVEEFKGGPPDSFYRYSTQKGRRMEEIRRKGMK